MSRLIVLPTPLSSSSIALGQLITDPIHGESASFSLPSEPAGQQSSIQSKFESIVAHDEFGRFISTMSERPSLAQDNLLVLNADESSYAYLTQPRASFDKFRRDATTQAFFQKSALQRQPLYYVTGIQKLKNPSLKHAVAREQRVAEAGPDSTIRLPMHVRRVDSASSLDKGNNITETVEESIFALELLQVQCRLGAASEPHSIEDIDYEWSYQSLNDEDLQLSIGLGKALEAAQLRALAGIIAEEDFTDASWDSRSDYDDDNDDGLGGF